MFTDLLDENMTEERGNLEDQSGPSAKRWSEIGQDNFPVPFFFSPLNFPAGLGLKSCSVGVIVS